MQIRCTSHSRTCRPPPAHDWHHLPDALPAVAERMRGVVVERRPALRILRRHDGPNVLHYVDPPYVHATRSTMKAGKFAYRYEMTDDDHRFLLEVLNGLQGMVVLSGYGGPSTTRPSRAGSATSSRRSPTVPGSGPKCYG